VTDGPNLEFGLLSPDRSDGSSCRAIRQPFVADPDGDGSDDLLVFLEGIDTDHTVLMAISASDRRGLWSSTFAAPDPRVVDLIEPEAAWPGCPRRADLHPRQNDPGERDD
jgi:hypothetical protein